MKQREGGQEPQIVRVAHKLTAAVVQSVHCQVISAVTNEVRILLVTSVTSACTQIKNEREYSFPIL